jgi:hypothetical protein
MAEKINRKCYRKKPNNLEYATVTIINSKGAKVVAGGTNPKENLMIFPGIYTIN